MSYHKHLSKDNVLKALIKAHGTVTIETRNNVFLMLCFSVMGQQLSTKVAAVIKQRFQKLISGKPTAAKILALSHEDLRGIGLSNAKATYIKNICRFFIEQKLTDKAIHRLSNDEFVEMITQIKGVGKWTAEMQLMFSLGREDVFSLGDYGLQKAMSRLYNLPVTGRKEFERQLLKITDAWRPYRTYACLHLWQYLDAKPG